MREPLNLFRFRAPSSLENQDEIYDPANEPRGQGDAGFHVDKNVHLTQIPGRGQLTTCV